MTATFLHRMCCSKLLSKNAQLFLSENLTHLDEEFPYLMSTLHSHTSKEISNEQKLSELLTVISDLKFFSSLGFHWMIKRIYQISTMLCLIIFWACAELLLTCTTLLNLERQMNPQLAFVNFSVAFRIMGFTFTNNNVIFSQILGVN